MPFIMQIYPHRSKPEKWNCICKKIYSQIPKYRIPKNFNKTTREFFLFSEKYGEAYGKITINEYIRQRIINNIMSATCEKSVICEYRYNFLIAFVQSATFSMYKQWITDGKKFSIEEIIDLTSDLLIGSMKKFLS